MADPYLAEDRSDQYNSIGGAGNPYGDLVRALVLCPEDASVHEDDGVFGEREGEVVHENADVEVEAHDDQVSNGDAIFVSADTTGDVPQRDTQMSHDEQLSWENRSVSQVVQRQLFRTGDLTNAKKANQSSHHSFSFGMTKRAHSLAMVQMVDMHVITATTATTEGALVSEACESGEGIF